MVEDALVEKDQGIHGLILGRRCDVALDSQVDETRLDLGFSRHEVGSRLHAVEPDEADDLLHRGPLRIDGVMLEPLDPPDLLDQGRWGTMWCVSHKKTLYWRPGIVENTAKAKLPENPLHTGVSG